MAGGSGTRLWPLSRKSQPKQALRLIGERTMFQHAVDRLAPLFPPERIFVVTNAAMAELLRPQTPWVPAANFILEPAPRDSAPAAGLAALRLLQRDPDAVMVILTADHYIGDTEQFRAALEAAGQAAADGTIVTLGIQPTYPATGFGYIELAEANTIIDGFRVYNSAGFREKPDEATAARFLEGGRHVWNSGMFVWRADRLLNEYKAQLPDLYQVLERIAQSGSGPDGESRMTEAWGDAPKVSIDFGIMEQAPRVAVIPVNLGWSDVGSWAALREIMSADENGNVLAGNVVSIDSTRCFVRGDGRLIALIGIEDTVVVDTPDVLLICAQDRAQDVRQVVNQLAADSKEEYL
ncbi:MAG TPA: mannose-1-phosphate guanylyltransferase [Anaerolineae bacterium]